MEIYPEAIKRTHEHYRHLLNRIRLDSILNNTVLAGLPEATLMHLFVFL